MYSNALIRIMVPQTQSFVNYYSGSSIVAKDN